MQLDGSDGAKATAAIKVCIPPVCIARGALAAQGGTSERHVPGLEEHKVCTLSREQHVRRQNEGRQLSRQTSQRWMQRTRVGRGGSECGKRIEGSRRFGEASSQETSHLLR